MERDVVIADPLDGEEDPLEGDPWAWAEFDEPEPDVDISKSQVTAVLVTHDAANWLPGTLQALNRLTFRPTRLIAIDNSSVDGSRALLEDAKSDGLLDAVYEGDRRFGFGKAITSALKQDRRVAEAGDWLWLLHDDAAPNPDALARLLNHVIVDPAIDITGPKLLLPKGRQAPQQISEVGISISSTGRRELHLEAGEIDQGQRDKIADWLGVSTCGMLVKQEVWEAVDGLDPDLPVFRDGVDFGWRAQLAGYRVVTTPRAEMVHRQAGRAGLRPHGAGGKHPVRLDRALGLRVVAAHATWWQLPLVWLRLVWSCLLHMVGYLIGKVPGRAWDELIALGAFVLNPAKIIRMRARMARQPKTTAGRERVASLRPPWWSSLKVGVEMVSVAIADRYRSVAGEGDSASIDELTGDDFAVNTSTEKPQNPWLSPIVLAAALSVIASLVAARSLFGLGSLHGPALLPIAGSLDQVWHRFLAPIPGAPDALPAPWLGIIALGSSVTFARPEWFITLLICGIVPLSLLSAYPVVRRAVHGRQLRLWTAGTYALLPVLLGGTNQGRLTLSAMAIGLPILVLSGRALVLRRPRTPEAWRGGWGAGLVLGALVAFEPSLMVLALALGLIGAVALSHSPRKAGRIAVALGVPLVVLMPWWPTIIDSWGRALTGPDSALNGTPAAPQVLAMLLGRETGGGLPPIWVGAIVFGAIWLVALAGLIRGFSSRAVLVGWTVALLSLVLAVLISRLVVQVPPSALEVRPWSGAYLLIAFGGLILAGAAGVDGLTSQLGERSFTFLQPATVLAGFLIGLTSLVGAGWWVWGGLAGPIDRTALNDVPSYILNAQLAEGRVRTLAIDLSESEVNYSVISDDQTRLGDADRGFAYGGSAQARQQINDVVVRLVAGTADQDLAPQLRDLGIGFVWVSGASTEEAARIDNTPGLGNASGNERGIAWQLAGPVSRSVLVGIDGTRAITESGLTIAPSTEPRTFKLGEPADPRWKATLNGQPLPVIAAGNWQQEFQVPSDGGVLEYSLTGPSRWWQVLQAILLLGAAILAAPAIRRPEVRDPARTARRAAVEEGEA